MLALSLSKLTCKSDQPSEEYNEKDEKLWLPVHTDWWNLLPIQNPSINLIIKGDLWHFFVSPSKFMAALHNQTLHTNFLQTLNPLQASKSSWNADENMCNITQMEYLSTSEMQWNLRWEGCWGQLFIKKYWTYFAHTNLKFTNPHPIRGSNSWCRAICK